MIRVDSASRFMSPSMFKLRSQGLTKHFCTKKLDFIKTLRHLSRFLNFRDAADVDGLQVKPLNDAV